MNVHAVVLNWNGLKDTMRCVEALAEAVGVQCTTHVVDNGSNPAERIELRNWMGRDGRFRLIENAENLGYAAGNNVGIRRALDEKADFIAIYNNDTAVARDALSVAVSVCRSLPRVGAVAFAVHDLEDPTRVQSHGLTLGQRLDGFPNRFESGGLHDVESVHGCAMLMTSECVRAVGLFDDRFFLMHEEADWSARVREAGFRIVCPTDAIVYHRGAASFGGQSPTKLYYGLRNIGLFLAKRGVPDRVWRRHLSKRGICVAKAELRQGRSAHASAALAAVVDALAGRWGERKSQRSYPLRLSVLRALNFVGAAGRRIQAKWRGEP